MDCALCLWVVLAPPFQVVSIEVKSGGAWPEWWEFQTTILVDDVPHETFTSSVPFEVETGSHRFEAPGEIVDPSGAPHIFSHWERASDTQILGFSPSQSLDIAAADQIWAIYARAIEGVPGVKGVNYYASLHSWTSMWTDWDPALVAVELDHAVVLGCGVVETYLQYTAFYDEATQGVNPLMVGRAQHFAALAAQRGLQVQFTLLDFIWDVGPENHAHHLAYLDGVVPALKGPTLHGWGLKNEVNLLLNDGNTVDEILAWGNTMLSRVRALDPGRPVEIEIARDPGGKGFEEGWFEPLLANADRVGLSSYYWTGTYRQVMRDLVKAYVDYGRPVLISEFGWHTHGDTLEETALNEWKQMQIYSTVPFVASKQGTGVRAWCLTDFAQAPSPAERSFGLVSFLEAPDGTLSYSYKPPFWIYQAWAPPADAPVPGAEPTPTVPEAFPPPRQAGRDGACAARAPVEAGPAAATLAALLFIAADARRQRRAIAGGDPSRGRSAARKLHARRGSAHRLPESRP